MHPTAFPRVFPHAEAAQEQAQKSSINRKTLSFRAALPRGICFSGSSKARNDIAFRFGFCKDAEYSAHAEAEDRKLRKDPSWRSLL
jgi:hypothetical protein